MDSRNIASSQQQSPQAAWTWKRQSLQGLGLSINLYYQKKLFDDIRSILTVVGGEETLQQFMDGCFGHLMHFIGGTSCGKALHELLSHEINLSGAREDELWFRIGGTNIRFAPPEYALVTGFCFGSFSFDPLESHEIPPDGVYRRFCSGHPITIGDLWKRFRMQLVCGPEDDYLKVAHILALYLMGMGYNKPKTVDQWVWVLVEDLDMWNRFPWGAYTYQTLMHYVSILPRKRTNLGRKYHFYGPVWALQIWAYEAIPDLGRTCALVTGKFTMPRCLKWSFPSRYINFNFTHFFEQEFVCSVTLDPTDEEQLLPYWLSVQTPQPLGVRYTPPWNPLRGRPRVVHRVVASCRVTRRTPVVESSSVDGSVQSTPSPSASPRRRPKRTRRYTRSSSSSGEEHDRPQHVFDEDQFAERVTQRLIESAVERLMPQMKEWIDELFRRARQSPSQHNPQPVHDQSISKMNRSGQSEREMGRSISNEEDCDDLNESQVNEYKEVSYKLFQYRTYKLRGSNGELRCPFCAYNEEENNCHYTLLLLHAIRVAEVSKSGKQKANHFAMARYLAIELADEVKAEAERLSWRSYKDGKRLNKSCGDQD